MAKFKDLNLSNAFLFAAVMQDEENCRMFLERALGVKVGKVHVHVEEPFLYSTDYRSIRLDVFAADEARSEYNLEMQGQDEGNLPRRSRFYQAEMDVTALQPGEDFQALGSVYIIFICTFDPFGKGLYRYTFENRCIEQDFPLGDGARRIFLNTKGTNAAQVSPELVNLLRYVEDTTEECANSTHDAKIHELHERIATLKASREWEARYMRFQELLDNARKDGLKEGRKTGQNIILSLIRLMNEHQESSLIPRLEEDPDFLASQLEKYHLS